MTSAFDGAPLGRYTTRNRVVMAPMTRSRAYGPGATPTELMATYYAQRAGAGLIITEGTQPSPVGQGYLNTPGLHTPEQVAAWRPITAAVHERGGLIFAQLMHTGRIGHPSLHGATPVGASPVPAAGTGEAPTGWAPCRLGCPIRPVCMSWAKIRPPRSCTAAVIGCQAATCSAACRPGVFR